MPEIIILEKSIIIHATPAKIYKALTNAKELTRWRADHAESDPRIGGVIGYVRGEHEGRGIYKRLIPNREVAIDWDRHEHILPEDLTVFRLEKIAQGTRVYVDDFALPEEVARIGTEWEILLKRLKKVYQAAQPATKAKAKAKPVSKTPVKRKQVTKAKPKHKK